MICEILDPRTQKTILGSVIIQKASDFVQSNNLVSQILAMISEDRAVKNILNELLGPAGADLAVVVPDKYVVAGLSCQLVQGRAGLGQVLVRP